MKIRAVSIYFLCWVACLFVVPVAQRAADKEVHRLYVAVPGVRNYVEHGGVGILVYDINAGHKFVKRIPTWDVPLGQMPENVKGIAASAKTGKLYVSTIRRVACFDLTSEKKTVGEDIRGWR